MISDSDIMERCARAGLALADVAWRDELLLLRPRSTDELPEADVLAALGDELRVQTGARWVALDVDAWTEAS